MSTNQERPDDSHVPCCAEPSPAHESELIVKLGESVHFDSNTRVDRVVNSGSITLDAPLFVKELVNEGAITSSEEELEITAELLTGNGSVSSPATIVLRSQTNLTIRGGRFSAESLRFVIDGDLNAHADRIDGKVDVKAKNVALGVSEGHLHIAHQCIDDPIYYNSGGDVTIPGSYTVNNDFVALATGNINADSAGTIDVTGPLNGGKITMAAGATFTVTGGSSPITCGDCSTLFSFTDPVSGNGSINLGNVSLKTNDNTVTLKAGRSIEVGSIEETLPGTGGVIIEANGGKVKVNGKIDSGGPVLIQTPATLTSNGTDTTIEVTGNITTIGGQAVILYAGNNISTGAIDVSTSGTSLLGGGVDIKANMGASPTTTTAGFGIGGIGLSNGVNGTINADANDVGAGKTILVHIFNGGMGGINFFGPDKISVEVTNDKSGKIYLDADNGTISLASGTLSVDGVGSEGAGQIILLAKEVTATAGVTTVTASDNGSGIDHFVWIAAEKITRGAAGITIKADGDGPGDAVTAVGLFPKDAVTVATTLSIISGVPTVSFSVTASTSLKPLTVTGDGSISLRANGNNRRVFSYGFPLLYEGGALTVTANGDNTKVEFTGAAGMTSNPGIHFTNTIASIFANGLNNSNGGLARFSADSLDTVGMGDKFSVNANGAGTGSGGNIEFFLGENATTLFFGDVTQDFVVSAKSGSAGGNGGKVKVESGQEVWFDNFGGTAGNAIQVSAVSPNGDGGEISIKCSRFQIIGNTGLTLHADATGSGKGGSILLEGTSPAEGNDPFTIGPNSLANAFAFTANGGSSGSGGRVSVTTNRQDIVANGGNISVMAGTSGNGSGGTIELVSRLGSVSAAGTLNANAQGSGTAGTIALSGARAVSVLQGALQASGGSSGPGGTISVIGDPVEPDTVSTVTIENVTVIASAGTSGNQRGGTITFSSEGPIVISGMTTITANGAGSGRGGDISVVGLFPPTSQVAVGIFADGGSTGNGGTISIGNISPLGLTVTRLAAIQARGGSSQGNGGTIGISTFGKLTIAQLGRVDAAAQGNGIGGPITLSANVGVTLPLVGPQIQIGGQVTSNGGSSGGSGGSVTCIYVDNIGSGNVQVDASGIVRADSPSGAVGGNLTVRNDGSAGLNANVQGLFSSNKGTLVFDKDGQPVSVTASLGSAGGPLVGKVTADGSTVMIDVTSTNDLSLGDITAVSDATIRQHGSGNIKRQDGEISATNLVISSEAGNIGTDTEKVHTEVQTLNASTLNSGTGSLFIDNTLDGQLSILDAAGAGGTYSVRSSHGISIGDALSQTGDVSVLAGVSGTGTLLVRGPGIIRSVAGTTKLRNDQVSGIILLQDVTPPISILGGLGVQVSIGEPNEVCPASSPGCIPPGVTVTPPLSPLVFFGSNGVTANGANVVVGTHKVVFNTNSAAATSIDIKNGNFVAS